MIDLDRMSFADCFDDFVVRDVLYMTQNDSQILVQTWILCCKIKLGEIKEMRAREKNARKKCEIFWVKYAHSPLQTEIIDVKKIVELGHLPISIFTNGILYTCIDINGMRCTRFTCNRMIILRR